MTHWYISFATDAVFRGATVVEATDAEDAIKVASDRGLNPGGEAAILEIPLAAESKADLVAMKNRLVGKDEMLAMGGKRAADCSEEIQNKFNAQADVVCAGCNLSEQVPKS